MINQHDPVWQLTEFIPYQNELIRAEYDEPLSEPITPTGMIFRIAKNAAYCVSQASSFILGRVINVGIADIRSVGIPLLFLMGMIALLIIGGFGLSLFSKKYYFDYYVLCYLGVIFLFPAREPRYLLAILPFIFHYFITGANWLIIRAFPVTKKKYHTLVSAIFIVYFIFSNLTIDAKIVMSQHRTPYYSETVRNFINSIEWVGDNLPEESRIISVRAPWVVLFSGRWCVSFPWVDDQYTILDFFDKVKVEYLIVSPALHNRQRHLLPIIEDNPNLFQLLYGRGEVKVYKINYSLLRDRLGEIEK